MQPLLNVMCITWSISTANPAGQGLHLQKMLSVLFG